MSTYVPTASDIAKEKLKPWPGSFKNRLIITAGVASLPVLLSIITFSMGGLSNDAYSPNSALLITVRELQNNGTSLTWIATLYPPFSLLLAAFANFTGGYASLIMALMGSFLLSILVVSMIGILRQKRVPMKLRVILIGLIALNPIIYWLAIYNLPGIIGLTLLALGLAHTIRFVQWGGTYNGFIAGLMFAGAILANNTAILMVAIAIGAVITFRWFHGTRIAAIVGMVLVLIYPTILAMIGLAATSWVTRGNPLAFLSSAANKTDYSSLTHELSASIINIPALDWFHFGALTGFDGVTAFLPVLFLVGISSGVKGRLWAAVAGILFVLVQVPVTYFPISFPAGFPFIALTVMGIVLLSEERNRQKDNFIIVLCFAQLALGWLTAITRPDTVYPWLQLLLGIG